MSTTRSLAKAGLAAGITVLFAATTAIPSSATTPELTSGPPNKVTIGLAAVNGSGCRPGTAQVAMAPDNTAMTVTYSEFLAEAGPGITPSAFRKNCQLGVNIQIPSGFSLAVMKADYRGYAQIAAGATGSQRAAYYWQGDSSTQRAFTPIRGSFDGDYTFTDEAEMANLVWSPCGAQRVLNVNSELRINKGNSGAYSMMTADSTDLSVKTAFTFAWKRC